ncbi:CAF17-like 4Fe-4S cluster assembly/insertion protein YgfZ, partial [Solemya velum gill symbiont]|uniref:Folate-binding protein YgfZ n=1 Tax=Solemya velum gill symbiont TaxID=2340 RepID=A0A0B0H6K7_SOVGS
MSNIQLHELKHLAILIIEGEERETFLQGQLTNDVREVTQGESQLTGICTPKGRMLANMRMFPGDSRYYLVLAKELAEAIQKRLGMFILRSKVTISSGSDDYALLGVSGEAAELLPEAAQLTQADQAVLADDGCTLVRVAGESPRYMIVGPADAIEARRQSLQESAESADDATWQLDDIRAGLPLIQEPTVEAFVPQMTNMGLINGISFTKGCYTGQEVVARMQYLGKLKRRMYRVEIDGDCPVPGTDLYAPGSQSRQGAGKIVMSAPASDDKCEALIVTEVSSAESGDVRLLDENGPVLRFLDLPYAFEESE